MKLLAGFRVGEFMKNMAPDTVSHMVLLEALALKKFNREQVEDEEDFLELIIDLAGLHTQACSQNCIDPGSLPKWLMI